MCCAENAEDVTVPSHRYSIDHGADAAKALSQLRGLYPSIPVGFPQGSNDADGNYEHLIVALC
jgi:hypothetical protein